MARALAILGIVGIVAGCSLATNLDPLRGDGGVVDVFVPTDAPTSAAGFSISASPNPIHVGGPQSEILTVDVTRKNGFAGAVLVTVNGLPSGVTAAPVTITGVGGSINLGANGAQAGEYDVTVIGTSGDQVATAPLHLHVAGKLAVVTTTGSITLPKGNTQILVKLWGGGGGGASSSGGGTLGTGGGGGYAEDTITVADGATLDVDVGTGGKPSKNGGAGGGGYSAVRTGATILVQAGGGGGAGGACASVFGGNGGAGGGTSGLSGSNGGNNNGAGGPGTQTGGNALLLGENAGNDGPGGIPGGGAGEGNGCGGGGGGGGKWGGKAGNNGSTFQTTRGGCGGGGGSALFGTSGKATAGTGTMPGNAADPDASGAGTGGNGNTAGADGRVVIYLL